MGRHKKEVVDDVEESEEESEEEISDGETESKSEPELKREVKAEPERISIIATFKTRTSDGDRISHRYSADEETTQAALDNMIAEEPEEDRGQKWPNGVNLLVNVTATRGEYRFSRALAPHVGRAIFYGDEKGVKNVKLFTHLFGL